MKALAALQTRRQRHIHNLLVGYSLPTHLTIARMYMDVCLWGKYKLISSIYKYNSHKYVMRISECEKKSFKNIK